MHRSVAQQVIALPNPESSNLYKITTSKILVKVYMAVHAKILEQTAHCTVMKHRRTMLLLQEQASTVDPHGRKLAQVSPQSQHKCTALAVAPFPLSNMIEGINFLDSCAHL